METTTTTPTTSEPAEPAAPRSEEPASGTSTETAPEAEHVAVEKPSIWETIELRADELEDDLEEIVREGTARRITVKKDGEVVADFPLAVGVAGAVLAAPLAAVAAIAALIADCTIEVERYELTEATSATTASSSTPVASSPAAAAG